MIANSQIWVLLQKQKTFLTTEPSFQSPLSPLRDDFKNNCSVLCYVVTKSHRTLSLLQGHTVFNSPTDTFLSCCMIHFRVRTPLNKILNTLLPQIYFRYIFYNYWCFSTWPWAAEETIGRLLHHYSEPGRNIPHMWICVMAYQPQNNVFYFSTFFFYW